MDKTFKYSKSNLIYLGIVGLLLFVQFLIYSDKSPSHIGEFIGRLFAVVAFPTVVAWIIWLISGKRRMGASIAFHIVLTLIILGQVGQAVNKSIQSRQLQEIEAHKAAFKNEVLTLDDPDEYDAAYEKYTKSVQDGIKNLSQTSKGTEKRFFQIMNEYITDSVELANAWNDAYNVVLSSRILDYSLLTNDEEYAYQKEALRHYIQKTEDYKVFFNGMIPDLTKRLSVLGRDNQMAKGALNGARKKYRVQKPIFDPLMEAHIEYGKNMIRIVELLEAGKDRWSYENEQLMFSDDDDINRFNEIIDEMTANETTINVLAERLIEEM